MFKQLSLIFFLVFPLVAQTDREAELLRRIEGLEKRLAALESPAIQQTVASSNAPAPSKAPPTTDTGSSIFSGATINAYVDGYYGYNFNRPLGRINLLRADDVLDNNFSLNQTGLVIERSTDASLSKRFGYRLDLMFGQNTETLQGGAQNELRPQVYRNIFQAYGTVVAPIGKGLSVDFGKFSSALGPEGNYTKDQLNYSRSYFFNYLPFYHMGVRATYAFNDKFTFQYWLVNGANQTEDFNGLKSNAFLFTIKPTKSLTWQANYYVGEEGRDSQPIYNPGLPTLATQPGLSATPVLPRPNGKEHIFDTYATWNITPKLTFLGEGDYVVNRNYSNSSPAHVIGGAGYVKYQFTDAWAFAERFEYLSDRGGLFSGTTQAVKDSTTTLTYQFADGFQLRAEYRRDWSNRPFFLTDRSGLLKRNQDTATLGVLWWLGGKQGSW